jgi:hypothetical protein
MILKKAVVHRKGAKNAKVRKENQRLGICFDWIDHSLKGE